MKNARNDIRNNAGEMGGDTVAVQTNHQLALIDTVGFEGTYHTYDR